MSNDAGAGKKIETISWEYFDREVSHGPCHYCGENIITSGLDFNPYLAYKLKDGSNPRWHHECYSEALAKAIMTQHK